MIFYFFFFFFFFFNDTATTEIYTLSLHDALPIRPWVWAVPGLICISYLFAQFWALMHSAGRSDDIGMKDTIISLLAALSSFGTMVSIFVLWELDKFYLGAFQAMTIGAVTLTTFGELIFTAWVRYLFNRRYFSSVG